MFYNSDILTKRGPLARVWMASHLSTKLTKSTLLSTSIPTSVASILGQDLLPMALRLSGQLLLGVARIYSRKAKYLLDDCQETLGRVKKAFRPGQVDLLDEGAQAGHRGDAITLRAEPGGLEDILNYDSGNYWEMNFDVPAADAPTAGPSNLKKKANVSALADITLPDHSHAYAGAFFDDDLMAFANGDAAYDYGPEGAIDSQADYVAFDLGLDLELDDGLAAAKSGKGKRKADAMLGSDDDRSVELGRDRAESSIRAASEGANPFDFDGDVSMDKGIGGDQLDLGGMDEGDFFFPQDDPFRDMGGGDEDQNRGQHTPRATSVAVNGDLEELNASLDLTPKTAALLAANPKEPKNAKLKKQVVDRVTELEWEGAAVNKAALEQRKEALFVQPSYLPRSRNHLRLLERAADPTYYLPSPLDPVTNTYRFAPPSLIAPALQNLFKFPSRRALIKAAGRERSPSSAAEVELGRNRLNSEDLFGKDGGDVWGDMGGGVEDFDLGRAGSQADRDANDGHDGYEPVVDDFRFDIDPDETPRKKKAKLETYQAAALAEEDEGLSMSEGPLKVFDDARLGSASQSAHGGGATQTVTQSLGEEDEDAVLETGMRPGKWSRNTLKAVGVLRGELAQDDESKTVEFGQLADKASRRAVASMFFELLVLSTRECIKVEQAEPFGEITIASKDKLWSGPAVPAASQA